MADALLAYKFALEAMAIVGQLQAAQPAVKPTSFAPPPSLGELGEQVLNCYHPTGRYRKLDVIERPWSKQRDFAADNSILLRIEWKGTVNPKPYNSVVAVMVRKDQIPAQVTEENSKIGWSKKCYLNQWTTVRKPEPKK